MRVLFLVESRNENSRNYKINEEIIKNLENENLEYRIITPNTHNIKPCLGCKSCFDKGICPLDGLKDDNCEEIKSFLRWADIIIINHPVYAHSVSGDFKTLIDRLSHWLHTFELAKKGVIVLTTTDSNGAKETENYLKNILNGFGLLILETYTFYTSTDDRTKTVYINEIRELILNFNKHDLKSTPELESIFTYFKYIYLNSPDDNNEKKVWIKRGLLSKNSFQEVLNDE